MPGRGFRRADWRRDGGSATARKLSNLNVWLFGRAGGIIAGEIGQQHHDRRLPGRAMLSRPACREERRVGWLAGCGDPCSLWDGRIGLRKLTCEVSIPEYYRPWLCGVYVQLAVCTCMVEYDGMQALAARWEDCPLIAYR